MFLKCKFFLSVEKKHDGREILDQGIQLYL